MNGIVSWFFLDKCPANKRHLIWQTICKCCKYNDYPIYKWSWFRLRWERATKDNPDGSKIYLSFK